MRRKSKQINHSIELQNMSFKIGDVLVNEIVCIHVHSRKDRVISAKRQARKKYFGMKLFRACENKQYPNLGKFESHLQVLRDARKKKFSSILILEDDFKILIPRLAVPHPPSKWDMLYLGGNVQTVIPDPDTDASQTWKRVCCLMTHAYVVHGQVFDLIIKEATAALAEAQKTPESSAALHLDVWYCNVMHPKLNVYITTPERVIQLDGWSDVQRKMTSYRMRLTEASNAELTPPTSLSKPRMSQETRDGISFLRVALTDSVQNISDADLPVVALVTCIRNQPDFFQLQQWKYYQTEYPRNKLQWLIVDDSSDDIKVGPLIDGGDTTIKYLRCEMKGPNDFLPISRKINMAIKYLGPEVKYIMHFSPDCLYPTDHVRNRVKLLMSYPEYNCIGCTKYGVYDLTGEGASYEQTQPDAAGNPTMIFGPSLAYTPKWWKERPFDESQFTMETFYFIRGRWNRVLDVPYNMVCIAITHSGKTISETERYGMGGKAITSSVTGTARAKTNNSKGNHLDDGELIEKNVAAKQNDAAESFESGWDIQTKNMMLMLAGVLA